MTSVSMCPASDSRASELVQNAAITCTTKNVKMIPNASSKPPLVPLARAGQRRVRVERSWSCPCVTDPIIVASGDPSAVIAPTRYNVGPTPVL